MDADKFSERAAIAEYDGGLSRFQAETMAAEEQGLSRWSAINEIGKRLVGAVRDHREATRREPAHSLSELQRGQEKENRPMSKRDVRT